LRECNTDNKLRAMKEVNERMHEFRHVATLTRLAGLIVIALVLGGCWGSSSGSTGATSSATSTSLTLHGTPPASVAAGSNYSFQPTVSLSIDVVTFKIAQKPAWARFDSSTGALSGTPTKSNIGKTENITIIATNGSSSASIGPFAIVVDAPGGSGSATLSWAAPTENTNGSALTDLAGYHIHYGTSATDLAQEIDVAGATATTYVVSGLAAGTYYFTITAYTAVGTESAYSDLGTKSI
jgi:Putative Ig domain